MTFAVSSVLSKLETSSSIGMFAKDTGGCLISRLGLSRSKDETREISIAELSESLLFYFSAPALAKLNGAIFSKIYKTDKNTLTSDLKNLTGDILKNAKLAKFGQIMATFGVILPVVYGIAPMRNLITLKKTGKDEFTSVVALKDNKKEENKQNANGKIKSLLSKLALVSIGALALGGGTLMMSKNEKFYQRFEPILDKIIKWFNFSSKGDLELLHYGALIYPASILGYFRACRDKYEVKENIRRFSLTVPLLFFGDKIIQNPIYKAFDKKFGTDIFNNGNIKTYEEIFKMPDNIKKTALKSKNFSYGITFLINTFMIAGAIALLNRIKTKHDYEKDNKNTNIGNTLSKNKLYGRIFDKVNV